jgi:hypothetical protein
LAGLLLGGGGKKNLQQNDQDKRGISIDHIYQAHHHVVYPGAAIAREQAVADTDEKTDDSPDKGNRDGNPRTVDQAAQHVPAQAVRAEQVAMAG